MKTTLAAAFTLIAMSACNTGQPRIYRVAIDESPVRQPLPPDCYRGNIVPAAADQRQNFRHDADWVIWDGADGKQQYLDTGAISYALGDAPKVDVADAIEGADKTFIGIRTRITPLGNDRTDTRRTQVTVTFNDFSASPTGTVALQGQYLCQGNACPNNNMDPETRSCQATLNFVARRIDVQNLTVYGNTGRY